MRVTEGFLKKHIKKDILIRKQGNGVKYTMRSYVTCTTGPIYGRDKNKKIRMSWLVVSSMQRKPKTRIKTILQDNRIR